jgi:stage V sporulation protein G
MHLTEVRINLCGDHNSRLKAFCSLTFDHAFVVRDVKLIAGNDTLSAGNGQQRIFLAMPSRKLSDHCTRCNEKNHLRARYCNHCGNRLDENRYLRYQNGNGNGHSRVKLHADIAHPIKTECRHEVEQQVLAAYFMEVEKSKQPGYVAPSLDGEDDDFYDCRPDRAVSSAIAAHSAVGAIQ